MILIYSQNLLLQGGFVFLSLFLSLKAMNSLPVYFYFIVLSFLVSLVVYTRKTDFYLRLFPPFLLITIAVEYYGNYLANRGKSNILLYNLFSTCMFIFFFYIIALLVRRRNAKNIMLLLIVLYPAAALINMFFFQVNSIHTTTYAAGCFLIVGCCIYYFYELFRQPAGGSLLVNPAFWISTGLLFYYICGIPLFGFISIWRNLPRVIVESYFTFVTLVNIFLYTLFTIGFLCIRTRKYSLLPS